MEASSIDVFRALRGFQARPIFLLKVDTEGYDAFVLEGAQEAIRAGLVKFIVAELNWKWKVTIDDKPSKWSLRSLTEALWSWGLECHFMTPTHFVPLSGDFWQSEYEIYYWSNFICAKKCDKDLLYIIEGFNRRQMVPRPECHDSSVARQS